MSKKVLIISDGKPGHLNQTIAFCKLKNLDYDIIEIKSSKSKKLLSYFLDKVNIYINLYFIQVPQSNYDAVVSTGSSTYYTNKYIAKQLKIKAIAIMLPSGFRYSDFDYILAQEHDNPPVLNNIITMPLNLSINTPKGYIKKSEKKSVGIILGGNNSIFTMERKSIETILDKIYEKYPNHLKYITTSRRTPKEIDKLLENYQFDYEIIYSKDPNINPIPDFIDVCDIIFVTVDSTSMLSETKANSNGKLNIIYLKSIKENTKFHRLAQNIEKIKNEFSYKKYLDKVVI